MKHILKSLPFIILIIVCGCEYRDMRYSIPTEIPITEKIYQRYTQCAVFKVGGEVNVNSLLSKNSNKYLRDHEKISAYNLWRQTPIEYDTFHDTAAAWMPIYEGHKCLEKNRELAEIYDYYLKNAGAFFSVNWNTVVFYMPKESMAYIVSWD